MRNSKGEKVRKRLIKRRGAGRRGERKGNTHSAMGLHLHIVPSPNITNGHPCCRSSNWPRVRRGEGRRGVRERVSVEGRIWCSKL